MTDDTENSSLPLLLAVSGAVALVAVGGWYLLDQEPALPASAEFVPAPSPEAMLEEESLTEPSVAAETIDLDAELLKAQLAADADILIFPPSQSALFYYGNILEVDPQHAVANAELDAALARVAQAVAEHLNAGEYTQAYEIAELVAAYRPEHELVTNTQRILDAQTEALIQQAIKHTQDGDDEAAASTLAEAEALPGHNADYFVGVRGSIQEIQQVRQAAEQDRVQRSRLAAAQARDAWVASTRDAIQQGNLITPAGASAKDLLAEENNWTKERDELTAELLQALIDTARFGIDSAQPAAAEPLLDAAVALGGETDVVAALRIDLENAYVEVESARVVQLDELVRLKTVPPVYPRRAEARGLSGSVDVEFTVTTDGSTSDVVVVAADPQSVFDISAVAAVQKWEFQPREFRGQTINQRASTRLVFRLDD